MYERTAGLVNKKFWEYLVPAIIMSAAGSLSVIVDSVIAGTLLGSGALAAANLASPLIYGVNLLHMLLCVGGITVASVAKGRRDDGVANQIFTISLTFGFFALLLYAVAGTVFAEPISQMLAQGDESLKALVLEYMRPLVWVGPPLAVSMGLALYARSDGNPSMAAKVGLVANGVNLILDYVLIKFVGMGIDGAGLATTLGYFASVIIVMPYFFSKQRTFHFVKPDKQFATNLANILRTGLPKGLAQAMSFLRTIVLNLIIVMVVGAAGLTAMAVCLNAQALSFIFVIGTTDTLLPIVGTLFGEGDSYGIKGAFKTSSRFMVIICIAIVIFLMAFPQVMGSMFGVTAPEDLAVLEPALRMFALSLPFAAINRMLQNIYNTTGRENLASVLSVLEGFVFIIIPAIALAGISGDGIWLCFLIGEAATFIITLLIAQRIKQREDVQGILLIHEGDEADVRFEMSIPASVEAATGISREIIKFCTENGFSSIGANRVGVAVEEMAVNTAIHGKGKLKEVFIDLRLRMTEDVLTVTLRDNGTPFDPTVYQAVEENTYVISGIELMKTMASKYEYGHQLGFNTSVMSFGRDENGGK